MKTNSLMKQNSIPYHEVISNVDDLKKRIAILELKCREKEDFIKQESEQFLEDMKPANIIKRTLINTLSPVGPLSKYNIARNVLGFTVGTALKVFNKKKKLKSLPLNNPL